MASLVYLNIAIAVTSMTIAYSESSWIHSTVHHGWTLHPNDGISATAKDSIECLRRCINAYSSQCLAISFHESLVVCRHFTTRLVVLSGTTDEVMLLTQWASDMYIEVDVTYAEGDEQCKSLGGRVMARAELDAAYNRGYGIRDCKCGWVNDGVSQLIVRWAHGNCNSNKVGVASCNDQPVRKTWCTRRGM